MGTECLSVHALRRRWKPCKERLAERRRDHPTSIRLHRAFSWLARCEQLEPGQDDDLRLICLWIGFNALYGRWDEQRREPIPDRQSWGTFLDRLLAIDAAGHLSGALRDHRVLVDSILDDPYLSSFFWEEPTELQARRSRKARFDARTWYIDGNWAMVLRRLVERIYLLRCQLIHGAATCGGKLNRQSLATCVPMLRCVLNAALLVIIDDAGAEDFGVMCYPPLTSKQAIA